MGCATSVFTPAKKKEKTATERKAAWNEIRGRLPRATTPEDKQRRIELFKQFDKSNSGKLTFNETYEGCVNILHLNEFTNHLRDIARRAFSKAKDQGNKQASTGDENVVEFLEFRLMLCYIYDYFELTMMFDEIDTSGNMLLDKKEFSEAVPKLAEWGVKIDDPEEVFRSIDKNGSGSVTFDEFAAWAAAKKLDGDGDPDKE